MSWKLAILAETQEFFFLLPHHPSKKKKRGGGNLFGAEGLETQETSLVFQLSGGYL